MNRGNYETKSFPETLRGFYWLVIKKFPVYFGVIFFCGVLGKTLNMIFEPLVLKWMSQIFENTASFNGKIIESGSHQQLLRQNGTYKRLWNLQSAGFCDKK